MGPGLIAILPARLMDEMSDSMVRVAAWELRLLDGDRAAELEHLHLDGAEVHVRVEAVGLVVLGADRDVAAIDAGEGSDGRGEVVHAVVEGAVAAGGPEGDFRSLGELDRRQLLHQAFAGELAAQLEGRRSLGHVDVARALGFDVVGDLDVDGGEPGEVGVRAALQLELAHPPFEGEAALDLDGAADGRELDVAGRQQLAALDARVRRCSALMLLQPRRLTGALDVDLTGVGVVIDGGVLDAIAELAEVLYLVDGAAGSHLVVGDLHVDLAVDVLADGVVELELDELGRELVVLERGVDLGAGLEERQLVERHVQLAVERRAVDGEVERALGQLADHRRSLEAAYELGSVESRGWIPRPASARRCRPP